ncbi:hypothetical protein RD792_006837 [Penstemon davidsonii]|uniref:4-coumarate--CoA ligase n=1 Tax=Penstemon davidsonii TaxID=160366 RepID=A0ABR0DBG2_9LAMI|nr:hypothetical protein RD792_006837 [Penstemon davidsonii]
MSTHLNRQKELSSAMATANKTFDLKRKAMLESALAATDTMVDSTNKSSFPRNLSALNKSKRVTSISTKDFSNSNIANKSARQIAINDDLMNESHEQRGSNERISSSVRGPAKTKKTKRGPTIGWNTQEHTRKYGAKPSIVIPEGMDHPVGQHSSKHASQIGILVKVEAPMQVSGWKEIPEDTKDHLYKKLFDKLNYEHNKEHVKRCVKRSFAKSYSTFRSNAHIHYKKWRDEVGVELAKQHIYDRLANRPEDWLWLCDFWETDKFKQVSEKQSNNRAKLKTNHKLGTKSRAAHQYEKTLDDIDMYETEYYNPKTGWANEEVEAHHAHMKELQEQQNSLPEGASRMSSEKICIEVLGENSSYVKSKVVKSKKPLIGNIAVSESSEYQKKLEEELSTTKATMATLGYGMTEAGPVLSMSPSFAKQPLPTKSGSCGNVVRNAELKVVDPETGRSLPRNKPGEICIRGLQIMKGYLNDAEATARTIDVDGWLHTGDIGIVDDDEDVFIVDRVKELIKFKGFQVPPAELEALLISHPSIEDAAVVPQKDEAAGEVPVAFVVPSNGFALTEEDVKEFIAKQVVFYKRLHQVHFVHVIPKSPAGKILRKDLRAKLAAAY